MLTHCGVEKMATRTGPRKRVKLPRIECEYCGTALDLEQEVRSGPSGMKIDDDMLREPIFKLRITV
jgi:hypothetical protein